MSHLPERKEKICLNCNADLEGRFCHVCGQENIEPREGFWHLVTHFVFDLFHFDGKFLNSLKYLLFKPGFLSEEHLKGKRAAYLHPIRMYIFTSAFFFLLFFTFFQDNNSIVKVGKMNRVDEAKTTLKREKRKAKKVLSSLDNRKDSTLIDSLQKRIIAIDTDSILLSKDTSLVSKLKAIDTARLSDDAISFSNDTIKYNSVKFYDSVQERKSQKERDGFFTTIIQRKYLGLKTKYENDDIKIFKAIADKFIHSIPSLMFCSLPIYALVLALLFIRRKTFLYVDHIVYCIHLYCAVFIMVLLSLIISSGLGYLWNLLADISQVISAIVIAYYWYKSMRYFYKQSRFITLLKFLLLSIINTILISVLFVIFLIGSALTI